MKINSYNNSGYLPQSPTNRAEGKLDKTISNDNINNNRSTSGDTLGLSDETVKMKSIQRKIKDGYYDSPDIIKQVATKLLKSIDKSV